MTNERPAYGHGTAERWITSAVAVILVSLGGWFAREQSQATKEQAIKFDELKDRFIRVESKVESVHLALVDIPNIKMELVRMDLRLQQLEANKRASERREGER